MPTQKLKIIIPLMLLGCGLIAAWVMVTFRPHIIPEIPVKLIPVVTVKQLHAENIDMKVISQGLVSPKQQVDIVSEVAGKVIRLHPHFMVGGFFKHKDILAEIDSRDYDYALAKAQADISEAQRQLAMELAQAEQAENEWQALGEGEATPLAMREPQLAEAKAKLKAAEANLLQAQLNRSRCLIRAPFNGSFQTKAIGLGQYVQVGHSFTRIYATAEAEVRLPIALDQLAFINTNLGQGISTINQAPKVILTAHIAGKEQQWSARLVRTEGQVDENTGTIIVVAEITDPYQAKPGMPPLLNGLFVRGAISGKTVSNIFVLPPEALTADQQVWIVDNQQKLHKQAVNIIRNETDRVLINAGLQEGDRVVVSSPSLAFEGMAVSIVPHSDGSHR